MIVGGPCLSFLAEVLAGVHQRGDDFRLALFSESATLNADTRVYEPADEIVGRGYLPGGLPMPAQMIGLTGRAAWMTWVGSVTWPNETNLTARGGLVYNASRGNRAVGVIDFGQNIISTNGPFIVDMPDLPMLTVRL